MPTEHNIQNNQTQSNIIKYQLNDDGQQQQQIVISKLTLSEFRQQLSYISTKINELKQKRYCCQQKNWQPQLTNNINKILSQLKLEKLNNVFVRKYSDQIRLLNDFYNKKYHQSCFRFSYLLCPDIILRLIKIYEHVDDQFQYSISQISYLERCIYFYVNILYLKLFIMLVRVEDRRIQQFNKKIILQICKIADEKKQRQAKKRQKQKQREQRQQQMVKNEHRNRQSSISKKNTVNKKQSDSNRKQKNRQSFFNQYQQQKRHQSLPSPQFQFLFAYSNPINNNHKNSNINDNGNNDSLNNNNLNNKINNILSDNLSSSNKSKDLYKQFQQLQKQIMQINNNDWKQLISQQQWTSKSFYGWIQINNTQAKQTFLQFKDYKIRTNYIFDQINSCSFDLRSNLIRKIKRKKINQPKQYYYQLFSLYIDDSFDGKVRFWLSSDDNTIQNISKIDEYILLSMRIGIKQKLYRMRKQRLVIERDCSNWMFKNYTHLNQNFESIEQIRQRCLNNKVNRIHQQELDYQLASKKKHRRKLIQKIKENNERVIANIHNNKNKQQSSLKIHNKSNRINKTQSQNYHRSPSYTQSPIFQSSPIFLSSPFIKQSPLNRKQKIKKNFINAIFHVLKQKKEKQLKKQKRKSITKIKQKASIQNKQQGYNRDYSNPQAMQKSSPISQMIKNNNSYPQKYQNRSSRRKQ